MRFIVKPARKNARKITMCVLCSEDPRFCL
jgi:hypothetical protein